MILASLFLCVGMALAQTAVTGTVVSQEDGQPVVGATVRVTGTQAGTVTDANGKFSLQLPSGHDKLQVSYVGMETQEVTVRGRSVRVVMQPVLTDLDEVMVVAYGTSTKSAFTGSAAVVDAEDINKAQVTNPVDALVGKVSGVQAYQNFGPARPARRQDVNQHPRYQAQSTRALSRSTLLTARRSRATSTL